MTERKIKIYAVLLSVTSLTAALLGACGKSGDKNADLVFKKNGKIYYRLNEGDDAYELVTDGNGETVVDENGNMLWKVTDADGNDQTHPVSFPAYINDGRTVSCQEFSITLPKGWSNTGNLKVMLRSSDGTKGIDYQLMENDEERTYKGTDVVAELEELLAPQIEEGKLVIEKEDVQIAGRDALKVTMEVTEEDGGKIFSENYYLDHPQGCMFFSCLDEDAKKPGSFDFKAILDTIDFRV